MFSTIKYYIAAAAAAIFAGLWIALKIVSGQRDKARNRADTAEKQVAAGNRQREKEQAASQAQAAARQEAKELADDEADRIAAGDRPDRWGDSRLREKD